jgi:uncharacterized metal-binding protein
MPQKRAHQKLTLLTALATIPLAPAADLYQFAAFEFGILITLLPEFTPDLDVNHRRFGVISEFIGLKAYAKLVPHRHGLRKRHWSRLRIWNIFFFSHIPFAGTLLRTALLVLPMLFLVLVFELFYPEVFEGMLFIWLGMSVSDTIHTIADKLYSMIKKKRGFKEADKAYWQQRKNRGRKNLTSHSRHDTL